MAKPEVDLKVWQARFDAVNAVIEHFKSNLGGPDPDMIQSLQHLLGCLQEFAHGQAHFLLDGFDQDGKDYELVESPEFHPDYVLRVTLNQIAFDLELIRRMANQRLLGSAEMQDTLKLADKLAWSALYPVLGENKLVKDTKTTVITYFEKDPSIRVIPYAPVALIGVPFSAIKVPQDFLAIAHEVGHYVYRHSRLGDEAMPRALAAELKNEAEYPKWVEKWKEEIFADIYDCLVAGPVIALASQDLALRSSLTPEDVNGYHIFGEFTEDDGEHPVPVLRPYIYISVLRERGLEAMAHLLERRWRNFDQVKAVKEITPHYSNASKPIPIKRAREEMETIVDEILECLNPNNGMVQANAPADLWAVKWSVDPAGAQPVEAEPTAEPDFPPLSEMETKALAEMYEQFGRDLKDGVIPKVALPDLPGVEAPPAGKPEQPHLFWKKWIKEEGFFRGNAEEQQPPKKGIRIYPGVATKLEYLEQERPDAWIQILHADGWATEIGQHAGG
jgi:hypothetical protein